MIFILFKVIGSSWYSGFHCNKKQIKVLYTEFINYFLRFEITARAIIKELGEYVPGHTNTLSLSSIKEFLTVPYYIEWYRSPDSRKIFADYINSKISPKTLLAITSHYENDFKDVDCDIFSLDGKLPVQGIQIPIMQKATDILCLNNKNDENGIQAPEK